MASLAWEAATGMPRVAVVAAMRQEWVLWVAAPLAVVVSFVFWRVVIDQLPGGDGR